MDPIDSIVVVAFGGPEGPDDVMPFLRNVTRGRDVPDQRLSVVADQYATVGGKSPINDLNRSLVTALETELANHGIDLPVYWGNRNWTPYLTDTVKQMAADGRKHALAFVTSAYSSFSGCRQYREDIAAARLTSGSSAPQIDKIRQFFNHPLFIETMVRNTETAIRHLGAARPPRLIFTAHSIPRSMAATCRYETQLRNAAELIVEQLGDTYTWDLAFQSRSGSSQVPWLEPDVLDHLDSLAAKGIHDAVIVPIGFVADHMEIIYDLDVLAAKRAAERGITIARAATVGTDPQFITMIRELIEEQIRGDKPKSIGSLGVVDCLGDMCCPTSH